MKILQIIPMHNWFAVYDMNDGNGPLAKTIAFLALIEHDGVQKVVGYDGGEKFLSAEVQENFIGYYHKDELQEMLVEEIDEG